MKKQFLEAINSGKFLSAIHIGNYQEAKKITCSMAINDLSQFLIDQSIEEESINIYTFVCFLLMEHESTALHYCATGILDHGLCTLEGASSASLFHARRAAELSPNDISCKKELLCYYGMPDQVMSRTEAKKIAQEILLKDPTNDKALKVVETIKKIEKFE